MNHPRACAAGALAGSFGVAPTANVNAERRFPSMFEPIHGFAFDITEKGGDLGGLPHVMKGSSASHLCRLAWLNVNLGQVGSFHDRELDTVRMVDRSISEPMAVE